jgi:hypothetical protein
MAIMHRLVHHNVILMLHGLALCIFEIRIILSFTKMK